MRRTILLGVSFAALCWPLTAVTQPAPKQLTEQQIDEIIVRDSL